MQDPTANEMRAYLAERQPWDGETDPDIDVEEAIYWFAADHHGGQGSNLYSALSQSPYKPSPTHNGCSDELSCDMYEDLVDKFAR
jgi:hypothetical protein